jgi:hypothetical protein
MKLSMSERSLTRRTETMQGILTFTSLQEALHAGFQVYDRTSDGYLVRTRTSAGWALARVLMRSAV